MASDPSWCSWFAIPDRQSGPPELYTLFDLTGARPYSIRNYVFAKRANPISQHTTKPEFPLPLSTRIADGRQLLSNRSRRECNAILRSKFHRSGAAYLCGCWNLLAGGVTSTVLEHIRLQYQPTSSQLRCACVSRSVCISEFVLLD